MGVDGGLGREEIVVVIDDTHEKAKATRAQRTTVASNMFHKSLQ